MRRDISAWIRNSKGKPDESVEALFESFLYYMKAERGLDATDIARLAEKGNVSVPITVFAFGLSPSEALCKYLKENKGLPFRKIGVLLNRDERSAWTSYQRAQKKHPHQFQIADDVLLVPLSIFSDRDLSILEHVVSFTLAKTGMNIPALSRLLGKHPSALHTVAKRAAKKQSKRQPQSKHQSQQSLHDGGGEKKDSESGKNHLVAGVGDGRL